MTESGETDRRSADAFQVWTYAINCGLDMDDPPDQASAEQQARIDFYLDAVVEELEADPGRLAAVAAECGGRAEQDRAAGRQPDHGDVWGAYLADLGVARVRAAGGETDSRKRERLLSQIHERTTPSPTPTRWQRLRQRLRNWRWPRKRRRLNPVWWWRRHQLRRAVTLEQPRRDRDVLIIVASLDENAIAKIGFKVCETCRRGLICKVATDWPYGGYGIGTMLVDAALTAGGRPSDGFTWYTTPQNADARGFWRTMARRHRTPFTPGSTAACAHMRTDERRA